MSGGFLERWSKRKVDEGKPDTPEDRAAPAPPVAGPLSDAAPDAPADIAPLVSEEELAALPRIEDLTSESSLAPFLRAGVPSGLKNAAMRRMWLLTPAIRDHSDCAVDYHWDWNTPGGVPGSGGRMDPLSVQKMLRGLSEPHPRPAEEQEAAEIPDAAEDADPETLPDAKAVPDSVAAPAAQPTPVAAPDTLAQAADPAETVQRKRHGGAKPG